MSTTPTSQTYQYYLTFTPTFAPTPVSAPAPTPTTTFSQPPAPIPPAEPMEVDALHAKPHGPLTEAEREECCAKGLCMYCGSPGHVKANCPNHSPEAICCFAKTASPSASAKTA
jgi:hypothetical protein